MPSGKAEAVGIGSTQGTTVIDLSLGFGLFFKKFFILLECDEAIFIV